MYSFQNSIYQKKLEFIKQHVENKWNSCIPPHYFVPHGSKHSETVEKKISELIPAENLRVFLSSKTTTEKEKWEHYLFCLYSAAWLHDIGMIPDDKDIQKIINNPSSYMKLRSIHHKRSAKYVINNKDNLNLIQKEADDISKLCLFHRKKMNIHECTPFELQLSAAYLRLADALSVGIERVEKDQALYKLFLTMGMPLSSEFHWLKSYWIREIEVDHTNSSIIIHFSLKKCEFDNYDLLIQYSIDEIREEFELVKDIINKGQLTIITDISYKNDHYFPEGIIDSIKIKQIISRLKMDPTASASELFELSKDTIKFILKSCHDDNELKRQLNNCRKSLIKSLIKKRPCHILIRELDQICDPQIYDTKSELKEEIQNKLEEITKKRTEALDSIANGFAADKLKNSGSILLFGYSTTIIRTLQKMDPHMKEKTIIYICECRSKDKYNYKNQLIYCDGKRYAEQVSKIGFKQIFLIPDIIAGNLIYREKIHKILFGANVIYLNLKKKRAEKVGHTAGHYSLIYSAKQKKVPIYILADSHKYISLDENLDENLNEERDVDWFVGDEHIKKELEEKNIKLLNPRADIIDLMEIEDFVYLSSEFGTVPPYNIPPELIEKVKNRTRRST